MHEGAHPPTDPSTGAPAPQTCQGAGLVLLKALQEKLISQRSGHKRDSRGPCFPGTCPHANPLPRARVTGAIIFLPSSKQRNWGLCQVVWAAHVRGGEGCQASQGPDGDLLGLTATRNPQVGPTRPQAHGETCPGPCAVAQAVRASGTSLLQPDCTARGASAPPVLLLF